MLLALQCVANLRKVLVEARKVHSQQGYSRLTEPVLLEIQQREQEIFDSLSSDLESTSRELESLGAFVPTAVVAS